MAAVLGFTAFLAIEVMRRRLSPLARNVLARNGHSFIQTRPKNA
jgi:hypothetical protein